MSAEEESDMMMCCAACGIAEVDDIKLKTCTACTLVRYCSVKCQKDHRPQHKRECKKRSAELRDEILFKQPESNFLGDCPICLLPLPIDSEKSTMMSCCSKVICNGCKYANWKREVEPKCPFCRHPAFYTQEEAELINTKRVKANDPVAICEMGVYRDIAGDYEGAFQHYTKAAELGNIKAHFQLSCSYRDGEGVEKDEKKAVYHLEQAAIGGEPNARYNLGALEVKNGRLDRAVKHFIIAANLGFDDSLENLKKFFRMGIVSKQDFAAALRGHQAAVDATKSPQREVADAALRKQKQG